LTNQEQPEVDAPQGGTVKSRSGIAVNKEELPMLSLLGILLVNLVLLGFLLAGAVGVGLVLHWIFPSVDFGIGILIGMVGIGMTTKLFLRITDAMPDGAQGEAEHDRGRGGRRVYVIEPIARRTRGKKRSPRPDDSSGESRWR
jgi:hypothetical protein